ncbi:MAG TPA: flavodoxin family protein [Candidatus Fusicatenibacter merdavium]|uniref:Flavodoxin family protein n=1 Tax=Candidatus Fusicatenibacter merdavium TaxID=2838600 RepID=A0A9D1XFN6_9FIRM|nr:flavodoxin family protein [Candidatus Fusicatenibacter merdavium]
MKYLVVYSSRTGNTEMLAKQVKKTLGAEECLSFGAPSEEARAAAEHAEVIFAGFWTDKGNCEEPMGEFLEGLENAKIVLFGTAGFGQSQDYFNRILANVKGHLNGSNRVVGAWMCQGKMPLSVRKRYEAMQEQDPERAAQLIANFDQALGHPDAGDLEAFRGFIGNLFHCIGKESAKQS